MLLLVLTACTHGSIDVTGPEAFGPVASAWWSPGDQLEIYQLGEGGLTSVGPGVLDEAIRLFDEPASCDELADHWATWADASEALVASADPCADATTFLGRLAAAAGDPVPHRAYLGFCLGPACDGPLEAGTFVTGDEAEDEAWAMLQLTYEGGTDEAARALDAWDADACAFTGDTSDDDDAWLMNPGEIAIETVTDDAVEGSFSGTLTNEDGEEDGAIEGEFDAQRCDQVDADVIVFY